MSEEAVQKKEPKRPAPRTFYAFQYQTGVLKELGVFTDLMDCVEKTRVTKEGAELEHWWPMPETEVNRVIQIVRAHPEPTAVFALDYYGEETERKIPGIIYFGDFPNQEAALAHRAAKGDPNEEKWEILNTENLRQWKTATSEGPRMKLIPD